MSDVTSPRDVLAQHRLGGRLAAVGRDRGPFGPMLGGRFVAGTAGAHVASDAVEFCRTLSGRAPGQGLLGTAVPF